MIILTILKLGRLLHNTNFDFLRTPEPVIGALGTFN